jgi:hypothetical protein
MDEDVLVADSFLRSQAQGNQDHPTAMLLLFATVATVNWNRSVVASVCSQSFVFVVLHCNSQQTSLSYENIHNRCRVLLKQSMKSAAAMFCHCQDPAMMSHPAFFEPSTKLQHRDYIFKYKVISDRAREFKVSPGHKVPSVQALLDLLSMGLGTPTVLWVDDEAYLYLRPIEKEFEITEECMPRVRFGTETNEVMIKFTTEQSKAAAMAMLLTLPDDDDDSKKRLCPVRVKNAPKLPAEIWRLSVSRNPFRLWSFYHCQLNASMCSELCPFAKGLLFNKCFTTDSGSALALAMGSRKDKMRRVSFSGTFPMSPENMVELLSKPDSIDTLSITEVTFDDVASAALGSANVQSLELFRVALVWEEFAQAWDAGQMTHTGPKHLTYFPKWVPAPFLAPPSLDFMFGTHFEHLMTSLATNQRLETLSLSMEYNFNLPEPALERCMDALSKNNCLKSLTLMSIPGNARGEFRLHDFWLHLFEALALNTKLERLNANTLYNSDKAEKAMRTHMLARLLDCNTTLRSVDFDLNIVDGGVWNVAVHPRLRRNQMLKHLQEFKDRRASLALVGKAAAQASSKNEHDSFWMLLREYPCLVPSPTTMSLISDTQSVSMDIS